MLLVAVTASDDVTVVDALAQVLVDDGAVVLEIAVMVVDVDPVVSLVAAIGIGSLIKVVTVICICCCWFKPLM